MTFINLDNYAPIISRPVDSSLFLQKKYTAEIAITSAAISSVESDAVTALLQDLATENLATKIRYLSLLSGDAFAFRVPVIGSANLTDTGSPTVSYGRKTGLSMTGTQQSGLRTGFIATANGLTARNHSKGVYLLQTGNAGIPFGSGGSFGNSSNSAYLLFGGFSRLGGVSLPHPNNLGLQSISANNATVRTHNRYLQVASAANPATETAGTESVLLNHFNGSNNFLSNSTIGAAFESTALTQRETGIVSGILDRYHFLIGRKQALSGIFFGDSITSGVGVSETGNRYSSQVAAALGIGENNQGLSGTCLQSGSFDGTVVPSINRYQSSIINNANRSHVFIMLGTNDAHKGADYTPALFTVALTQVISDCLNAGIYRKNIFLATIPWATAATYTVPGTGLAWAEQYVQAIKDVATSQGVNLVDVYAATYNRTDLFSDGLHPNDPGAQIIAGAFIDAFHSAISIGG